MFFSIVLLAASIQTPNDHAYSLVASQSKPQKLYKELEGEAKKIKNPDRQKDALDLLLHSEYRVLKLRAAEENKIIENLKSKNLLTPETKKIFPGHPPMNFLAAPGGPWKGHHAYPAGLVYHTLANLKIGLGIAQTYKQVYGIDVDESLVRLAALWHDGAKTFTLRWKEDGSLTQPEPKIAGTAEHHIFGIAEALIRGWSPKEVVVLACAHSATGKDFDSKDIIPFLQAGALIADVPFEKAGLTKDGKSFAGPIPVEGFINHLDDHDYIFSVYSMNKVAPEIDQKEKIKTDYWKRDEALSKEGDISIYFKNLTLTH